LGKVRVAGTFRGKKGRGSNKVAEEERKFAKLSLGAPPKREKVVWKKRKEAHPRRMIKIEGRTLYRKEGTGMRENRPGGKKGEAHQGLRQSVKGGWSTIEYLEEKMRLRCFRREGGRSRFHSEKRGKRSTLRSK